MTDPYTIAIIGIGGTIVGALLGAWITFRFSLYLSEINTKREAGRKLITTFSNELKDIYPLPVKWPEDINSFLRSVYPNLQAAIGEFRYYVPLEKRESFDQTWLRYYNDHDDARCQSYHHYMAFGDNPNFKEHFKHNVDTILEFAKKT